MVRSHSYRGGSHRVATTGKIAHRYPGKSTRASKIARALGIMNRKHTLTLVALLGFYCISYVILTYPLILRFGSCFIGDKWDACIFAWNVYNFTDSIHHGVNPFFTDKIFYPFGASLILHVYAPLYGIVGLLTGNCGLALNVTTFASFVLSGIGAYLLCNYYVRNGPISALAGFVFAYCPYKLVHLHGHYDLILTAGIPFFILFFVKSFKQTEGHRLPELADRRSFTTALGFFGLTVLSCYYYAFFLIVFVILYFLYWGARVYDINLSKKKALRYILIVIIFSTLIDNIFKFIHLDRTGVATNGLAGSSDLFAFLVPSAYSRFLAFDAVRHIKFDIFRVNTVETTVYIGYTILVFAIAYFVTKQHRNEKPETKMLSYMVGCFLVLAMPKVRILDETTFSLPTALVHYIPLINNFRAPYRYSIMIMLFLPILSGLFLKRYVLASIPRRLHFLFVSVLILFLFIEYMQKDYPMVCRYEVPRIYDQLASKEDGVLLEIPFGLRDGFRRLGDERTVELYYQTIHHKKILAGVISRRSRRLFNRFRQQPLAWDLIKMQEDSSWTPAAPNREEVIGFLNTFNVRYILVHPEYRNGRIEHLIEGAFSDYITERAEIDGFALLTLGHEPLGSRESNSRGQL